MLQVETIIIKKILDNTYMDDTIIVEEKDQLDMIMNTIILTKYDEKMVNN